ncbi:hypothetical protein CFP65_1296 [Kitasatospora sp. MMS16-BH015]|uniref:DUF3761 domain-containing protein n=1 Tax=Kitasatospora sp. MMS16-BH015 TaxID=2018025 RepID=UPI000CA2769A|nr:DUF3761 domain-containing protein [Kitasatospora sp. MMS16-BH015]AUG76195.1 hypothetical protein CFP65_1296 [Kitasatospora sp. MMS16-BH015]
MTRTPHLSTLPRALAIAAVSVAAFLTACDPVAPPNTQNHVEAAVTTPASPSASPTPVVTPTPAPVVTPTPTPTPVVSTPPAQAPAPAPTPTHHASPTATRPAAVPPPVITAEPPATKAAGGSCGHHTVAVCGWDVGQTPTVPNEMAECKDGTPSTSATPSGTCSHHGGVLYWFK